MTFAFMVLCFEGISELAATEVEDEQLWDGQARSSRYQDFSRSGFVTPPELSVEDSAAYQAACENWGKAPDPAVRAYNETYETKRADLKVFEASA